MQKPSARPWSLWLVVAVLVLLSIGALPAGYSMIVDPSGAGLGMTDAWLAGSPFPTFFVPGLFLFSVIGVGGLGVAALLVWRRERWVWLLGLGLGLFLMAWITVQVMSLSKPSWMQPTVFVCGLLVALLLATPGVRQRYSR